MSLIQVDPQLVIKKLFEENSRLTREKILLEVAYEDLQEEHDKILGESKKAITPSPEIGGSPKP